MHETLKRYMEPNKKLRTAEIVLLALSLLAALLSFVIGTGKIDADPGELVYLGSTEMVRDLDKKDKVLFLLSGGGPTNSAASSATSTRASASSPVLIPPVSRTGILTLLLASMFNSENHPGSETPFIIKPLTPPEMSSRSAPAFAKIRQAFGISSFWLPPSA